MKVVANFFALLAMLTVLSTFPAVSHAQTGGWAAPKGEVAFSQNRFPELKGLTYSQEDQAKAANLCSQHGGGDEGRLCMLAAKYYMQEGQQEADAQKQQELSSVQASAQTGQSQQSGEASALPVATQEPASVPSASTPAQTAVESFSDDDIVDYLAKALVVYAMDKGDAWICSANADVQQCRQRLNAFDDQHFPDVRSPPEEIVRGGRQVMKKRPVIVCKLKIYDSLETLREWGGVLKSDDESAWDSGIAGVRSRVNTGGCSSDEIAYFDKITAAALERAEDVVPKMKSQAADRSAALAQCKASAAYKRFDDAASIPNLKANLSTQESYLQEYQRTQPTTVQDANKLRNSIANEDDLIATIKEDLNKKSAEYQSLGGDVRDEGHMSKDASSNPCAALGDDWQHDLQ